MTQCAGQPAEVLKLPLRVQLVSRRVYVLWARLFVALSCSRSRGHLACTEGRVLFAHINIQLQMYGYVSCLINDLVECKCRS